MTSGKSLFHWGDVPRSDCHVSQSTWPSPPRFLTNSTIYYQQIGTAWQIIFWVNLSKIKVRPRPIKFQRNLHSPPSSPDWKMGLASAPRKSLDERPQRPLTAVSFDPIFPLVAEIDFSAELVSCQSDKPVGDLPVLTRVHVAVKHVARRT